MCGIETIPTVERSVEPLEYRSCSVEQTEAFGVRLGQALRGGAVVAFRGALGMGKTALTRGIACGLGCRGRVTSPTFTIVNEYPGAIPLFHFDMYRLSSAEELFQELDGLNEHTDGVFMNWQERERQRRLKEEEEKRKQEEEEKKR